MLAFLEELAVEADCAGDVDRLLRRYVTVDPRLVRALGGDRFALWRLYPLGATG